MTLADFAKKAAPMAAILSCLIYAAQALGLLSSFVSTSLHAEYATREDLRRLETKVTTILDMMERQNGPQHDSRPARGLNETVPTDQSGVGPSGNDSGCRGDYCPRRR